MFRRQSYCKGHVCSFPRPPFYFPLHHSSLNNTCKQVWGNPPAIFHDTDDSTSILCNHQVEGDVGLQKRRRIRTEYVLVCVHVYEWMSESRIFAFNAVRVFPCLHPHHNFGGRKGEEGNAFKPSGGGLIIWEVVWTETGKLFPCSEGGWSQKYAGLLV